MKYIVEDTESGFRVTALTGGGKPLREGVIPGSHSEAAEAYALLERASLTTPRATVPDGTLLRYVPRLAGGAGGLLARGG